MEDLTTSQDEAPNTMAETIRETLRGIQEREPEAEEPKIDRPQGKDEKPTVEAKDTTEKPEKVEVKEEEETKPEIKNPRWNKKALEALESIKEPAIKEAIRQAGLLRDKSIFDGIEGYKQPAEKWAKLQTTIGDEGLNYLRAKANGDEFSAIKGLIGLEQWANSKPQEFIQWFAKNAGIQLGEQQQAVPAQTVDPRFQTLEQQLNMLTQREVQRAQQHQQQQLQTVEQSLEVFTTQHDADGLLDDWFDSPSGPQPGPFSQKFVAFMKSGAAQSYEEAYRLARASTPEVAEADAAKLRSEAVEQERKAAAVRRAQRARSVNVAPRGNLPPIAPVGTMKDTIAQEYRRLMGS